jgi:hypothetical protein
MLTPCHAVRAQEETVPVKMMKSIVTELKVGRPIACDRSEMVTLAMSTVNHFRVGRPIVYNRPTITSMISTIEDGHGISVP